MDQAFVGTEEGTGLVEMFPTGGSWLAALWEAGEQTGTVPPFTSCDMAAVAGSAKSEPSQSAKEQQRERRIVVWEVLLEAHRLLRITRAQL